jgi:hypothetical protein
MEQTNAALVEVYTFLCPLYNYWYPSFKRVSKEKQSDISEKCKAELWRRRALYTPVELNRGVKQGHRETLETKP